MSDGRGGKLIDLVGSRFGRLVVLSLAGRSSNRQTRWMCKCDCGNTKVIVRSSLTSGHSKSCGCLHRRANGDATTRKGVKRPPEYSAWRGMITRCTNRKDKHWHDYGGRGIKICDQWRKSYVSFLDHVGRRPTARHSLDRINVNGNYEPGNVRWATSDVQHANRRHVQRRNWREAAKHAYRIVDEFEYVLASYTGSRYAVAVESCTAALKIACAYLKVETVSIPRYTYCSVPQSIINAGGKVVWRDEEWSGMYRLSPYPIWDSARLFTSGMFIPGSFMCVSFHWSKHLSIGRGGAILLDDKKARDWMFRARFDGRKKGVSPSHDKGLIVGWHDYMTPPQAAQGLMLMASLPEHNEPLPNDDYPDLSQLECFK